LEALDPEQNKYFYDHYLDVSFDMSNVFFIATANTVDTIPFALRDRLEIIYLSSYTESEKIIIAKRYLIPKKLVEHGITEDQVNFSDEAITEIISSYTREAGVRELQRVLASVCRATAEKIVSNPEISSLTITKDDLKEILGIPKFFDEIQEKKARPGLVTGLAWTPFGGEILSVEASIMPGTGQLKLTGQLGDVMKESALIALSYIRAELSAFTKNYQFDKQDIHIHVPSGANPKDGPSAGITLLTAMTSLLTGTGVDPAIAMTGEITLLGSILPVGGIKEKVLAAHRAGIKTLFLPARNQAEFSELPIEVSSKLQIHFVDDVEQVLTEVLKFPNLHEVISKKAI